MDIFVGMKLEDFDYHLPTERIAQTPLEPRDSSRLLILEKKSGNIHDTIFKNIADYLWENDVLVVNKTRVINTRLKASVEVCGGSTPEERKEVRTREVEVFLHKQIDNNTWDCLVYPGKRFKVWAEIVFETGILTAKVIGNSEMWRIIQFNTWGVDFLNIIEKIWNTPLPPYIKEKLDDVERYQTIYSEKEGSSAAPTAGLHFTDGLLEKLEKKWVQIEKVLLHVWLGTFLDIKTESIETHHMHSEFIELDDLTATRLNQYKKEWKRIIAVGTTSVRVLESFSNKDWILKPWSTDTDIFIYPGYKWKFVDSLITNFHLPKSTLLMLVSSLAWEENIKKAYEHAIEKKYRFFSFGDAMWIQ